MSSKANSSGYRNTNDFNPDQLPEIDSEQGVVQQQANVSQDYYNQIDRPVESVGQILENSNQNINIYQQKTIQNKPLTNSKIIFISVISGIIAAILIIVIALTTAN